MQGLSPVALAESHQALQAPPRNFGGQSPLVARVNCVRAVLGVSSWGSVLGVRRSSGSLGRHEPQEALPPTFLGILCAFSGSRGRHELLKSGPPIFLGVLCAFFRSLGRHEPRDALTPIFLGVLCAFSGSLGRQEPQDALPPIFLGILCAFSRSLGRPQNEILSSCL